MVVPTRAVSSEIEGSDLESDRERSMFVNVKNCYTTRTSRLFVVVLSTVCLLIFYESLASVFDFCFDWELPTKDNLEEYWLVVNDTDERIKIYITEQEIHSKWWLLDRPGIFVQVTTNSKHKMILPRTEPQIQDADYSETVVQSMHMANETHKTYNPVSKIQNITNLQEFGINYKLCSTAALEETNIIPSCTFRVCEPSGTEILLDKLFIMNDTSGSKCAYRRVIERQPNVFRGLEQAASNQRLGSVVMYPDSRFIDNGGCERWFFDSSGRGAEYVHSYMQQRIPTSGISAAVFYSPRGTTGDIEDIMESKPARRYLVIYAAATLDEYRLEVSNFTLRRLRAALGANTFIIYVEAVPRSDLRVSTAALMELADVSLFADFVSSNTYYDSAAMQEGMLEAFRLFGVSLLGFYGLIITNDSTMGPIMALGDVLPAFSDDQPVLIGWAVWARVVVCGCGVLVNRAAFTVPAFSDYWRFSRFPCGKWGAMMMWEGQVRQSLSVEVGSSCYTFTNNIDAISAHPTQWDALQLPFFKHKGKEDDVLHYIRSHEPESTTFGAAPAVEVCQF